MIPKHTPNSRMGWHEHYTRRYNKHKGGDQAAHLAMWYLLLHLAFDAPQVSPRKTKPHSRGYFTESSHDTRHQQVTQG